MGIHDGSMLICWDSFVIFMLPIPVKLIHDGSLLICWYLFVICYIHVTNTFQLIDLLMHFLFGIHVSIMKWINFNACVKTSYLTSSRVKSRVKMSHETATATASTQCLFLCDVILFVPPITVVSKHAALSREHNWKMSRGIIAWRIMSTSPWDYHKQI